MADRTVKKDDRIFKNDDDLRTDSNCDLNSSFQAVAGGNAGREGAARFDHEKRKRTYDKISKSKIVFDRFTGTFSKDRLLALREL
jgi:hypothetical protein